MLSRLTSSLRDILFENTPETRGRSFSRALYSRARAPDRGRVLVGQKQEPVKRGDVSVVAQAYPLFERYTVRENLDVAARQHGLAKDGARERVDKMLERLASVGGGGVSDELLTCSGQCCGYVVLLGRRRPDGDGKTIGGARIVHAMDLMERGIALSGDMALPHSSRGRSGRWRGGLRNCERMGAWTTTEASASYRLIQTEIGWGRGRRSPKFSRDRGLGL